MAEPIGIAASVLAFSIALGKTARILENVANAPQELLQLTNEVADTRVVLETVHQFVTDMAADGAMREHDLGLRTLLDRMPPLIESLEVFTQSSLYPTGSTRSSSKQKLRMLSWQWQKSTVKFIKESLQDVKINILAVLTTIHSSKTIKIAVQVQQLIIQDDESQARIGQYYQQSITQQAEGSNQLRHLQDLLHSLQLTLQTREAGSMRTGSHSDGSSARLPKSPQLQHVREGPIVQVKTTMIRSTECSMFCHCQCHSTTRFQTPEWLRSTFGLLFVGYSAIPVLNRRPCNERSCRKSSEPSFNVVYFFPLWFLSRMFNLRGRLRTTEPIEANWFARAPRVVPGDAAIAVKSFQLDIGAVQSLFSQKKASPFDVQLGIGNSPLHYAVSQQSFELCRFLLDNKADPYLVDSSYESPADLAWDMYFSNPSSSTALAIRNCFDETAIDKREFPQLHRIVLGLEDAVDLETALRISTAAVNDVDARGRTAVAWAACIGDIESVKLLLKAGANPNILESQGHGPLHLVSLAPNALSLEPLIQAGADLNSREWFNETPLNRACGSGTHGDDVRYIEPLVVAGADFSIPNGYMNRQPLHQAVLSDRAQMAAFLITAGADHEAIDKEGYTPLLGAVMYNCHKAIKMLLDMGADVSKRSKEGRTVVHLAAIAGDVDTMRILAADQRLVSSLGWDEKDFDGKTAQDLRYTSAVEREEEYSEQAEEAFRELLRCLREAAATKDVLDSDQEDVYFDAPE